MVDTKGFVWNNIIKQAAILGLSMTEVFEMDLWQLSCYIEGYNERVIRDKVSMVELAVLTGQYTGQYFSGKKAPDPNNLINKIRNSNESSSDEEAEKKIAELKKQLKYFK